MSRHWYFTVSAITAMLVSGVASAQPPRNPPPGRPAAPSSPAAPMSGPAGAATGKYLAIPGMFPLSMSSVQREIGVTPDQKQQLKAVSDAYAATSQRLAAA